ncbi:MAG: FAD-binding oxidoreductase [Chloroflexi bacterium]|nr:MAG: FAD-binding oxidoreductase [Chloroflexota bacterium]
MREINSQQAPVVIIGGGIVGSAAAYYLARRGVKAVLLEKNTIGVEASGRNGGGVRAQCRVRIERRLAMASIKLWEGLEAETGMDMEYTQGGNIRLAATEARMAQLQAEAEEELADGLYVELWNRDELRRRAPYLDSDHFIGAKYCPTDGVANPILATWGIAAAARKAGATLLTHTEAVSIETQAGQVTGVTARTPDGILHLETPRVIHAAGVHTPQLAQTSGVQIPIKPARVFVAVTQPVRPFFTEFVSTHDFGVYFRPARKGHVHIGSVGIFDETFDKSTPDYALPRLATAARLVPALRGVSFLRTWAGILAMTPDHLPVIGPVDGLEGLILATGFSGHGFCLGPIVGKLLSEMILDGAPSINLDALNLSRFASTVQSPTSPSSNRL